MHHEPLLRSGVFFGLLVLFATAEALWPRRARGSARTARWPSNLGIVVLDQLVARVLLPMAPIAFAALVADQGGGLLPLLGIGGVAAVVVSVVFLDFAIYLQHAMFHAVPVLWRLHRMHHADTDIDVTTALRFHPVEIVLSLGIKFFVIAALGAPPVAVLLFEVILNGMAMFNHANLALPAPIDAALRVLVVTPDMHRVHHSTRRDEMHTNFGFNLSLWDRLFGTYVAQPKQGHDGMEIGLPCFRDPAELRLDRLVTQPFRDDAACERGRAPASAGPAITDR
ncbi:MAG: sterol desaturase family protein [Alphaproteobacteria bacterium]|nr:sterol desaturase family protein [Alphaproteobacteria bacterium]